MSDTQEDVSLAAAALADLQRARDEAAEAERESIVIDAVARLADVFGEAFSNAIDNHNFSRGWDEARTKDEARASPNGQERSARSAKNGAPQKHFELVPFERITFDGAEEWLVKGSIAKAWRWGAQ